MTTAEQQLADFIRVKRHEVGKEQAQLAEEIGVGRTAVVNWENAHAIPSPERSDAIAGALNVDPEAFRQLLAEVLAQRVKKRMDDRQNPTIRLGQVLTDRFAVIEQRVQALEAEIEILQSSLDTYTRNHA